MLDTWINNNVAQQLWRGHKARVIRLDANGLRQGCVLSPILYLLIINALVSARPDIEMPAWDSGFIDSAFNQGVQHLRERADLGTWLVYLFVDDTAFISSDIDTTNLLLGSYHNFTVKWRIRVNPGKCKVLRNKYCDQAGEVHFGAETVPAVEYLKYLGYWLGVKGRIKNDTIIKALATQLRFKIRGMVEVLGEYLTKVYLEIYVASSILYGADLGNLSNSDLDGFQSWSLSELLGIGRRGKASHLMEGEVRKLCVFADYDGPTWSQLRMRSAMVTYRSIMRMQPLTIPRSMMRRRGEKSVLYINIMRKLGGGELSKGEARQRLAMCTGKNKGTVTGRKSWGAGMKERMAVEYTCWLNKLQEEV